MSPTRNDNRKLMATRGADGRISWAWVGSSFVAPIVFSTVNPSKISTGNTTNQTREVKQ